MSITFLEIWLREYNAVSIFLLYATCPIIVLLSHRGNIFLLYAVAATISFSQSQYSIVEGNEPLKPLLLLSNPSSYVITIQVESINGNASGKYNNGYVFVTACWQSCKGNDYTSGPYNVTFPAGSTSVSFDVNVTNDDILESNETFNLNIISSSVPDQVIIGNPKQSTVTIVDYDSKW